MSHILGTDSPYLKHNEIKLRIRVILLGIALIVVVWLFIKILDTFMPTSFAVVIMLFFSFLGIAKVLSLIAENQIKWLHRADRGLEGEDAVAHELLKLPSSYAVYRNIQLRESCDIDCIVVGPNGIFTIEVKSHSGRIGYDGQELTLNNLPFKERDVLRQAKQEALDVHDYLLKQVNRDIFVTPIIVFSSDGVVIHFGMKQINHVYVIQKKWLIDCIVKINGSIQDTDEINAAIKPLVARKINEPSG